MINYSSHSWKKFKLREIDINVLKTLIFDVIMNMNGQEKVENNIEDDRNRIEDSSQNISVIPLYQRRDIDSSRNAYSSPYKGRISDKERDNSNQVCIVNNSFRYID